MVYIDCRFRVLRRRHAEAEAPDARSGLAWAEMTPRLLLVFCAAALAALLMFTAAGNSTAVSRDPVRQQAPKTSGRVYLAAADSARAASMGLLPSQVRSVLNVERRLHHGEFVWDEEGIPAGKVVVRVNLDRQLISIFRSGHEIGTAVVTFGARGRDTPVGNFPILAKMKDHRSSTYDAAMPYTLRLTNDGVSVHGSNVRWGTATHGCIGVPTEFARRLFDQVQVGQPVEIRSNVNKRTASA